MIPFIFQKLLPGGILILGAFFLYQGWDSLSFGHEPIAVPIIQPLESARSEAVDWEALGERLGSRNLFGDPEPAVDIIEPAPSIDDAELSSLPFKIQGIVSQPNGNGFVILSNNGQSGTFAIGESAFDMAVITSITADQVIFERNNGYERLEMARASSGLMHRVEPPPSMPSQSSPPHVAQPRNGTSNDQFYQNVRPLGYANSQAAQPEPEPGFTVASDHRSLMIHGLRRGDQVQSLEVDGQTVDPALLNDMSGFQDGVIVTAQVKRGPSVFFKTFEIQ